MNTIQTKTLRSSLGDVLNKTFYRSESFIIERRGDPIAVLVSMSEWRRIEQAFRDLDKLRVKS